MNKTGIEWVKNPDGTQGYTWNPITGCLKNCSWCYARKLANGRLKNRYTADYLNAVLPDPHLTGRLPSYAVPDPFYPRFWPKRLTDFNKGEFDIVKRVVPDYPEKGVFVCNMGELFGDWVPTAWQVFIFKVITNHPGHRFYLLTKQPQNLARFSPFPDNAWIGVTATNSDTFFNACTALEYPNTQAKIKYLSIEPLLEWNYHFTTGYLANALERAAINWVIIGAQTKPTKLPEIKWVEEIIEAADRVKIPVFLKHNLNSENLPDNAFNKEGLVRQEVPTNGTD